MAGHGGSFYNPKLSTTCRPMPSEKGSEQREGHFGRMFALGQTINEVTGEILAPHPSPVDDLRKLGAAETDKNNNVTGGVMVEMGDDAAAASLTPAGFTFLGQFIDHDITLDTTSSLDSPAMADQIQNGRTPNLDLDCVYGGGREASPFLYTRKNGLRGPWLAEGKDYGTGTRCDLRRMEPGSDDTAVIGDPRNDENAIVSQVQFAMIRFHNKLVDHYIAAKNKTPAKLTPHDAEDIFEIVRSHVIHYYHKVILEDFLPKLIGAKLVMEIATKGRRYYYKEGFVDHPNAQILAPFMPVEFSVAAYRFGHSQVRQEYLMRSATAVPLFDPTGNTGGLRGFQAIKPEHLIDWRYFFDFSKTSVSTPFDWQPARKIDTKLAAHLFQLDKVGVVDEGGLGSLASRNLNRGRIFRLPSGQDVARVMKVPDDGILTRENKKLSKTQLKKLATILDEVATVLHTEEMPLWFYILAEAEVLNDGEALGPVGGRIVGEVLLGLMDHYRERTGKGLDLIVDPDLQIKGEPLGKGDRFTFASLLVFAGLADDKLPVTVPVPKPKPKPKRGKP